MADESKPQTREDKLELALAVCKAKFQEYAELHAAKGTAEGFEKAQKNAELAQMCDEVLATERAERMTQEEILNVLRPFALAAQNRVMSWDGEKHIEIIRDDSDTLFGFTLTWGDVRRAQQAFIVLSERS